MGKTRFIVAGGFVDGSGADPRRNVFLAVQGSVIAAIGPASDLPPDEGAPVDDLSHCIILPALVDCSISLSCSPSVDGQVRAAAEKAGLAEKTALLERHIRYCHDHGVLGAADSDQCGLVAGYLAEKGPGRMVELQTADRRRGNSPDTAAGQPVGGDFLRIEYSGNIEDRDAFHPRFSPEELRRILESSGGRKTVVVANGRRLAEEALAAGCDAIEQGYGMGEDNLGKMAAGNVLWIPGLLRARNGLAGSVAGGVLCRFSQGHAAHGRPDPGAEAFWKKALAGQMEQLRLAGKLGVKTAIGTGAGSIGILHGESLAEEMKLFIKAGFSISETIRSASANGAGFFNMEKLGALTVGRPATFLIARGTLQQLPRKLSYLEGIYIGGVPSDSYRKW